MAIKLGHPPPTTIVVESASLKARREREQERQRQRELLEEQQQSAPAPVKAKQWASPIRPKKATWQRTEKILLKLYPEGMPPEHKTSAADIIKAIKIEWKIVPNPQHVQLPSDGTLRTIIKEERKTRPEPE